MLFNPVFGEFENLGLLIMKAEKQFNEHCAYRGYDVRIDSRSVVVDTRGSAAVYYGDISNPCYAAYHGVTLFAYMRGPADYSQAMPDYTPPEPPDYRARDMALELTKLWKVHVWIYGSFWNGSSAMKNGMILGNEVKEEPFTAKKTYAMLPEGVRRGIAANLELPWMNQMGIAMMRSSDIADDPRLADWKVWPRNRYDGGFLSIGNSGGVADAKYVAWHPRLGLLIPKGSLVADIDRENDAFQTITIAIIVIACVYAAGVVAGVWSAPAGGTFGAAAPAAEGAIATGAGETSIITAGTGSAESFAVVDTMSMSGISTTSFGAADALTYAGYASTANSFASGGSETASTTGGFASGAEQMPSKITNGEQLSKTGNDLFSLGTLKDAASAASALNQIYKVVKQPDGSSILVARGNTPPTYAQAAAGQYSGASSSMLWPVLAMAAVAIAGSI